jgi:hypothetical protein
MPPTLETADGKPVEIDADAVNAQFQAAKDDDGPDEQAPPKRQPKPAAEADKPAPRRGRPPKDERARTADKAAAPAKDDYTPDAQQFVGAVWTVAASISVTAPYALIVENSSDALVSSLAEGARHNSTIRAFVSSGESSWMLGLASVGIGMGLQAYQLMKDPGLRAQAAATTREHLKAAIGAKGLQVQESADVPAGA